MVGVGGSLVEVFVVFFRLLPMCKLFKKMYLGKFGGSVGLVFVLLNVDSGFRVWWNV